MILRAPNVLRLIQGKPRTALTSPSSSGTSTLTVESISGFAVGNYIIVGQIGDERSEVIRIHTGTAPSGSTITLNSNLSFRHEVGTPVIFTDFNQIEFSRATTESGSKSVLATSDMAADQIDTIYDDTTNSTGFGFFRFKNSAASTFSSYSDPIPYAGYDQDQAQAIFDRALAMVSETVSPKLLYSDLYNFINDFVDIANEESYSWSELKVLDYELDTLATGDFEITLPTNVRRRFDPSSILGLRIQNFPPLRYVPKRVWNELIREMVVTTIPSAITDVDTTITVANSKNLSDSGTIYINGDAIAYTGNTRASNLLTGVTGIATGGQAASSLVLQLPSFGTPIYYTFTETGDIRLWPVADGSVNNRVIFLDYYRRIPYCDSQGDHIYLQNISPAVQYVAWRIKKHLAGGSIDLTDPEYQQFLGRIRSLLTNDPTGQPQRLVIGWPSSRV